MTDRGKALVHDLLILVAIATAGGCWHAIAAFTARWEATMEFADHELPSFVSHWRDKLGDMHDVVVPREHGEGREHHIERWRAEVLAAKASLDQEGK